METSSLSAFDNSEKKSVGVKSVVSSFSKQLWNRLLSSVFRLWNLNILSRSTGPRLRSTRNRYRRRKSGLPLPVPMRISLESSSELLDETSRFCNVLEDILEHTFLNLHFVQKSLFFWRSRGEGTDVQKIYFMVFERGPLAFINGIFQLLHGYAMEANPGKHLCHSATVMILERIDVLTRLQDSLAAFLAQIYVEVDKFGKSLLKDRNRSLSSLLVTLDESFVRLEESVGHPHELFKVESSDSLDESKLLSLKFDKLFEINEQSKWTGCKLRDSINIIHQNLYRLDSYLHNVVARYCKPRRIQLYWLHYTCGAVGFSICSVWLLRHSSLMGSPDIDNWISEAKSSTMSFWKEHVELPLLSIRDELFETFQRRHKGTLELEEVQLTANSLHRMLLAFIEQTNDQMFPGNTSDQEMLEIVMGRYEKELMHPIKSILGGELARAALIQIQKLKLDIETAMLELNQILRANEINFAILAALPAFFLSLGLLTVLRAWIKQDEGVEGKGRLARLQRRLLVAEVDKRIKRLQDCVDKHLGEDALCSYGLVLHSLNRLYKAVERHAKDTSEWPSLREDIIELANPELNTSYKLGITLRMVQIYDCLLPSTKGR